MVAEDKRSRRTLANLAILDQRPDIPIRSFDAPKKHVGPDLQIWRCRAFRCHLPLNMADHDHQDVLDKILNPKPENAQKVLTRLGLDELPSREQVHHAIEEKLLLPKEKFPAHWLPHYQV